MYPSSDSLLKLRDGYRDLMEKKETKAKTRRRRTKGVPEDNVVFVFVANLDF